MADSAGGELMKIAYDPQIFFEQTYGGASRYFCEIASRISKIQGIQVSITAPMHINAYLEHVPRQIVSGFRFPKAEQLALPLRGVGMLVGDWMLRVMSPDIIHETYFFPYCLGSRRARRVLTIHDMIHEKFAATFSDSDRTAQFKSLAAERADHVICVSESTRRDATEILGLDPDKVSVIYLGFDLMNFTDVGVEEPFLPSNVPFLLYVGNRGRYKNFPRLLQAYGTSPELRRRYRLICFGGGAFHTDELKAMKMLGLNNGQVLQLGGGDQMLARLYERASAFIYPSLYEGFGIPPLEAMSHGCPVVCSNISSIPEVVGDAGEYFDPTDIECMCAAIESVVKSNSRRDALIARGRARLKCFSWDRCAAETLDIYHKLI